jgi:hypothetical protein
VLFKVGKLLVTVQFSSAEHQRSSQSEFFGRKLGELELVGIAALLTVIFVLFLLIRYLW